jgi:hypothetical protein
VSFTPNSDLTPGTHTVSLRVRNKRGRYSTATWSFKVPAYPVPVTATDAVPTYEGTATVGLTPSIAPWLGGTAGLRTYFILDGSPAEEGTSVVVSPPHSGSVRHGIIFWSVTSVGVVEARGSRSFSVAAPSDGAAPVTASDTQMYYPSPATIVLSADDADGWGVAHTYWRLDGGSWSDGPVTTVSEPGRHAIEFFSSDVAGNVELPVKSRTFVIDGEAPVTSSDALTAYAGPASIALTANDTLVGSGVAHTFWRLDGGEWQEGAIPPVAGEGLHTLEFYSVDRAGNSESVKSRTFRIDTNAPLTALQTVGAFSGSARFVLVPTDTLGIGVAATYYTVDSGGVQTGTVVEIPLPVTGSAIHMISYWSVDLAGNTEVHRSFQVTLTPDWTGGSGPI